MLNRILFVSHNASRSGAPLVLLNLMGWIRKNTNIDVETILIEGGELLPEFTQFGPTSVLIRSNPFGRGLFDRASRVVARRMHLNQLLLQTLGRRLSGRRFDLVYANTAAAGPVAQVLSRLQRPIVAHVHELEGAIQTIGQANFNKLRQATMHYIAASGAVRANLVGNHEIPASAVTVVHEFIAPPEQRGDAGSDARLLLKDRLGLPPDALVLGGCGRMDRGKGIDLFVQLAHRVRRQVSERPVYFVWIGPESSYVKMAELARDLLLSELQEVFHLPGSVPDAARMIAGFDVFALTSREDSFPLVSLEAAAAGAPVLCFERAGGAPEFVEDDSGFVVPFLDVEAMAARATQLLRDDDLRRRLGENAARKVRCRHTVDVAAPQVLDVARSVVERFSAAKPRGVVAGG